MGQNKVAYRKSASYLVWKCLKSLSVVEWWSGGVVGGWVVQLTTLSLPTRVEVELGYDNTPIDNIDILIR